MGTRSFGLVAAVAATFALAGAAQAAVIINGSFELNSAGPALGGFSTLGTGNTTITGWTVNSGSIDYINDYWDAQDGTHSLDLSGNGPGSIEQSFATTAGTLYTVNYYLSGNPDGGTLGKPGLIAAINGTAIEASSTFLGLKGASHRDMSWAPWQFQFTATGSQSTLRFTSTTSDAFGPALDSVSITPVPEPATWAMMIGGFALTGGAMRRSRRMKTVLA